MGHARLLRLAFVVGLGAVALAGCGRRGPLELPDGATPSPQAADAELDRQNRILQTENAPGLIQSPNKIYDESAATKLAERKPKRPINVPTTPKPSTFVLDPLL